MSSASSHHSHQTHLHFSSLCLLLNRGQGNQEAFQQVQRSLASFFYPHIPAEYINDAIQDTLLVAWKKRSDLCPDANAYNFLLGIARNIRKQYLERLAKKNHRFVPIETVSESESEDLRPNASDRISSEISSGGWRLDECVPFYLQYYEALEELLPLRRLC